MGKPKGFDDDHKKHKTMVKSSNVYSLIFFFFDWDDTVSVSFTNIYIYIS